MKKKRVYCQNCKFHWYGMKTATTDPWSSGGYGQHMSFPQHQCNEPHKAYTYSAITRIDSSDNCFIKNVDNDCKYFKKKKEVEK